MMPKPAAERFHLLDAILDKMDECSELIRKLGDERISASCLAAFESSERSERSIIEDAWREANEDAWREAAAREEAAREEAPCQICGRLRSDGNCYSGC